MISLVAGIFLLIALLSNFLSNGGGRWGVAGFAMAVTSLVFVFGLDYAEVFIFPTLAVEFPEVVERYGDGTMMPSVAFAFPMAGVLFVLGFVLFGWALGRQNTVPKPASIATIFGTLVFGAGLSGYMPMIVVRVGAVLFAVGLVLLGWSLWKGQSRYHEESALSS